MIRDLEIFAEESGNLGFSADGIVADGDFVFGGIGVVAISLIVEHRGEDGNIMNETINKAILLYF